MKHDKKFWFFVTALICLIYAALRFWNLTASCLWFDEIFGIHAAEYSWQNMFWFVAQDLIHPPLFYVLLKIWISVGGESLFWLRFFPVLFSIIAVIPFYSLCRELKLQLPAIAVALTFFTLNGSLIKYSQEIRMYSLLLCFALFSMWLFVRFLNTGKGFFALTLINIILVYTHYFGWFTVLSEVFAVLFLQRAKLGKILLMLSATLVSFAPWIYLVWQASKINADFAQNISWMTKPNLPVIFQFVFDLFEPFYYPQSSTETASVYFITVPLLLIIVTVFVFYFARWTDETETERHNFRLLLIFTFVPVILAFTASWILPVSVWGTRHLIIIFAPAAILLAAALSKIHIPRMKKVGLSVIFLLFGLAFLLETRREAPVYIWCAWENLAPQLPQTGGKLGEPIKIYVFEDLVAYHFWFALRDSGEKFQIIKVEKVENLTEDAAYFLPRGFDAVNTVDENSFTGEHFFVVFRASEFDYLKPPLVNLINKNYKISEPKIFQAQESKAFLVEVEKNNR